MRPNETDSGSPRGELAHRRSSETLFRENRRAVQCRPHFQPDQSLTRGEYSMKASAITAALRALIGQNQPVFVWGGPGLGKSAVVTQLASSLSIRLQDVRALLLDPVDLRGLPYLSEGGSK